jgi:hypothetical protein
MGNCIESTANESNYQLLITNYHCPDLIQQQQTPFVEKKSTGVGARHQ